MWRQSRWCFGLRNGRKEGSDGSKANDATFTAHGQCGRTSFSINKLQFSAPDVLLLSSQTGNNITTPVIRLKTWCTLGLSICAGNHIRQHGVKTISGHLLFPVNAVLLEIRNTEVRESIYVVTANPPLIRSHRKGSQKKTKLTHLTPCIAVLNESRTVHRVLKNSWCFCFVVTAQGFYTTPRSLLWKKYRSLLSGGPKYHMCN